MSLPPNPTRPLSPMSSTLSTSAPSVLGKLQEYDSGCGLRTAASTKSDRLTQHHATYTNNSGSIIKRVESSSIAKYISGGLVYWLYTYLTGLVYRPPPVKYTLTGGSAGADDGKEKQMGLYIMAVANGRYLGGNMHIAPKAQISDGQVRSRIARSLYTDQGAFYSFSSYTNQFFFILCLITHSLMLCACTT